MPPVKTTRRYDTSNRRERAQQNREAVVDAAEQQLLEKGYAGTSLAAIARQAGVSVQTIYKVFRGKAGLVKAIYERGLLGRAQEPAFNRSDTMRERETDPRKIMREWGKLTTEVASQIMPIRLLMRTVAQADEEMAALIKATDEEHMARMRHHARFLEERGYLRPGVTVEEAAEVLWTSSSLEVYELLVLRRGWTLQRFARFVGDFMMTALLPPACSHDQPGPTAEPPSGP